MGCGFGNKAPSRASPMALLRRATQTGSRVFLSCRTNNATRCATTAVVSATQETYEQKVYRWLDVMGYLTRWHSRRAWILDLDPPQRMATVMITEYERKL